MQYKMKSLRFLEACILPVAFHFNVKLRYSYADKLNLKNKLKKIFNETKIDVATKNSLPYSHKHWSYLIKRPSFLYSLYSISVATFVPSTTLTNLYLKHVPAKKLYG